MVSVDYTIYYGELTIGADHDVQSQESIDLFSACLGELPWVKYLFEHQKEITVSIHLERHSLTYNVRIEFRLDPEDETMYYLMYR
jgi:hypothetical protein